jgi:two-component system chemotaxis sensor kinase CheA
MSADTEILKEFLVESYENLDQLDRDFVALEKDPSERARIAAIFRTIHTLKGTACFLNFPKLAALTHAGESVLSRLRDGALALTPEITSALLAMVDGVREMLKHIETTENEGDDTYSTVIESLTRICADENEPKPEKSKLGEILVATGAVEPVELAAALEQQKHDSRKLGEILVSRGSVAPKAIVEALKVQAETTSVVSETNIRVDIGLLDKLMNLVGELVLARNQIVQLGATRRDAALVNASQRLNLVTTELQEGVMRTRMQPIASVWNKLPRVVRDLSLACGKQVEIELEGKETELDRTVIEAIKDPLTHIVRNTIDHGIEIPADRIAKGKPPVGRLHLRAFHEGGQVNIEISDDGAGVDLEKVRAKAIQRGIISAERAHQMSDGEITQLVFQPGFSTAERVTNVSGRGVGMDVVKTNIERTGGTVDLVSHPGAGTTIKIRIPLTLAIIPALIVALGADRYAIPQASLLELVRIEAGEVARRIESIRGTPVLRLRDKLLPLVDLRKVLAEPAVAKSDDVNVVILQADDRAFGLVVDVVKDTEEIVVKPLGRELKRLATFAGATILGDGRVALILDVAGVARRAEVLTEVREHASMTNDASASEAKGAAGQALLLVQRGAHDRIALPLSLVSRLEEFPCGQIEEVDSRRVMQYRGDILPLVSLDGVLGAGRVYDDVAAGKDRVQVVVLSNGAGSVGLEIDRILDIVYDRVVVKKAGARLGVSGTAVIQGRVTQMLDVGAAMAALGVAAAS